MPLPLPSASPPPGPIPDISASPVCSESGLAELLENLIADEVESEETKYLIRCMQLLMNVMKDRIKELEQEKEDMSSYMELLKKQNFDLDYYLQKAIRICKRQEEQINLFTALLKPEPESFEIVDLD